MNTKQLWTALHYNPDTNAIFDGVYSKDRIKNLTLRPDVIICNTDDSDKPGEHWVVFYFKGHCLEFFDSLGRDITFYGESFVNFAKKFALVTKQCNKRTQDPKTALCGECCLYYIHMRVNGKSMEEIVNCIPPSVEIEDYVKTVYGVSADYVTPLLQNCVEC